MREDTILSFKYTIDIYYIFNDIKNCIECWKINMVKKEDDIYFVIYLIRNNIYAT